MPADIEATAPAPGDRLITQQATKKASQVSKAMMRTSRSSNQGNRTAYSCSAVSTCSSAPAAYGLLEEQAVGNLQQGAGGVLTEILQGGVEQVDGYHPAFHAGLVGTLDDLDGIAQAKRSHGEDQQCAEHVRQHAPDGEERHRSDSGETGQRRPQDIRRYPQTLQYHEQRTAHDQPAHQATQRLQHLCRQQAVARTEAADGSGKNALGDPRQQDDQQHLAGANQRIAPGRQQLKLFHYSVSSSCCCNASR